MNDTLSLSLTQIIKKAPSTAPVKKRFLKKVKEGALTRDQNNESHVCVYFLPINRKEKKVFFVNHKKAGTWISPGGHIEKNELPKQAVIREFSEELGYNISKNQPLQPFLLTIVDIENTKRRCKTHFDIWFTVDTPINAFTVDTKEFFETKWMSIEEAKKLTKDKNNKTALSAVEKTIFL